MGCDGAIQEHVNVDEGGIGQAEVGIGEVATAQDHRLVIGDHQLGVQATIELPESRVRQRMKQFDFDAAANQCLEGLVHGASRQAIDQQTGSQALGGAFR